MLFALSCTAKDIKLVTRLLNFFRS